VSVKRLALFTGNYNYTRDGANLTLNRLARRLIARGTQVRVYSPTAPVPAFEPAGELVSIPSLPLPGRSDYRLALGMSAAARRDLLDFAPEVVHLSTPDPLGFQAQRLARLLGVPTVGSVHTRFDTYLDYYGVGWLAPVVERTVRRFYLGCDRILAPTAALAREMAPEAQDGAVRVWGRGVDRELFNPGRRSLEWRRAHGFGDHEAVALYLGRLVMEKGLAAFAGAVRLASAAAPMRVLVVGDGPARPWLQEQLPQAVFTGLLTGEALATAVASADLLFNPSATEAFGNVTLEAMASGLPVVCADLPNSRCMVTPGATGLLAPAGDIPGFAAALQALAGSRQRRAELGAAGLKASAAFGWEGCLDGVIAIYEELIAGGGAPLAEAA
jgi:glycosyltransferase involved in cell wall biosynthesis